MLYFMQILTEREADDASITDDNSSRKNKNELAEHNGWLTWGKKPKRAIKIQYVLCQEKEKKREATLFQRDDIKKIPIKSCLFLFKKKKTRKVNFSLWKRNCKSLEILSQVNSLSSLCLAHQAVGLGSDLSWKYVMTAEEREGEGPSCSTPSLS